MSMGAQKPAAGANELSPSRTRERQEWPEPASRRVVVTRDLLNERDRQNLKHPETDLCPDGTGADWVARANAARAECDAAAANGRLTWRHVLLEEVLEAFAEEPGSAGLRGELVQAMAVCARWIETLDRRADGELVVRG